jgi:hypothetical protein
MPATLQNIAAGSVEEGVSRGLLRASRPWQQKLAGALGFTIIGLGILRINRNRQLARIESKLDELEE